MTRSVCSAVAVLILAGAVRNLDAQATGTINGNITDGAGLIVAGAAVTARNTGTNLTRVQTSDVNGGYTFPLLPVGTYEVEIEHAGFSPFKQRNIILQANTTVEVDARLEVRTVEQRVTVVDTPVMVQSTSTTLVQVIDTRRIEELPLNGRNVLQLTSLNAGITDRNSAGGTRQINTLAGGGYAAPVSINGSRGNGTNYLLDNASNNDGYTNIAEPFPNPDAVQEVSVQTSTFDAQYGRGVGGVVNVVTKSGTNQFHGAAYDFVRNYKMNARNFFSGRDALKRNQFGATLGGPVTLPGLYRGRDKTFFFFAYQGTRARSSTPETLRSAPSEAMKQGDFSAWLRPDGTGAIRDPLNPGQYFPGNRIPISRFDPVSAKMLQYIPSTADPSYLLRFATPTAIDDDNQYTVRGDHALSEKNRISMRYFLLKYNHPWQTIPGNLLFLSAGQFASAHNATVNFTSVIRPSLLNEATIAFHRSTPTAIPPPDISNVSFQDFGSRVQVVPGFPTMDVGISNWSGISLGLGYYSPQTTYQVADVVSYTAGRHNMRFGGEFKRYRLDVRSYWTSGGSISFNGQMLSDPGKTNAGNAFAEFLLGQGSSWRQQSFSSWTLFNNYPSLFMQDDIRLSRKVTVNLGVRWDPKFDYSESSRKRTTFLPGAQSTVYPKAPRGLLFLGDPGFGDYIVPPDWNNLAPRVGFAWELRPKTVIRSAYGIFMDQPPAIMNNRSAQGEPFVRQASINGPLSLSDPYAGGPVLDPSPTVPGPGFEFRPYGTWAVPGRDIRTGYMQNWNLIVEQQLAQDLLIRLAYVGSKGTKLLNAMEINPGIYGPGATAANINDRRPYQPIGALQLGSSNGNSSYNALQVTVQKRYARNFSVLANYTWSKSIDNASYGSIEGNTAGPNPFNLRDNRGLSDFDLRHRLVVSGILDHPRLEGTHPVVRNTLGGWQSNFIYMAQSGPPITIGSGVDNALMGVGGNFADLTGQDWQLSGDRPQGEQILKWFNTAAFRTNAIGTIGTGRRNQLTAPGAWNLDYSLFKNFRLTEQFNLQFRGEFFNLLNHTRLGAPNTTVTSPNFGRITSAFDPRIVQLALRLRF